jgi:hypothetical protein
LSLADAAMPLTVLIVGIDQGKTTWGIMMDRSHARRSWTWLI